MQEREKNKTKNKKPKHQHPNDQNSTKPVTDFSFKSSSDVKGLRFGGQLVVKSFTIRRARPLELLPLLSISPPSTDGATAPQKPPFPSTTAYLPTNFTILAHHAWHTLTLGLGTKKSKVVLFVFESEAMKATIDRIFPSEIPLGEVNKRMIRGLTNCEMARFKFRKGCVTFYVYAARWKGELGFSCAEDLKKILESVVALKDLLDHTAMLAMPSQRNIAFQAPMAVAH
ncbi:uncharacterized protein LOC124936302 [Impatiens glandulifera]|uniref:uncharacterized protein LOC124936302 n=1 Tax=Impatiens glandulifera TaxID=253017 RepID=UPI001FB0643F|nr:uncharacterized protein LOC124936302 [Impatiens glandulifera]